MSQEVESALGLDPESETGKSLEDLITVSYYARNGNKIDLTLSSHINGTSPVITQKETSKDGVIVRSENPEEVLSALRHALPVYKN